MKTIKILIQDTKEIKSKKGETFYIVSLARSYKKANGEWVNADVFVDKKTYDALQSDDGTGLYAFSSKSNLSVL